MNPSSEPRFLSIEEVRLLHGLAILEFGGENGLRDPHLLDSALAQPKAMFSGSYLHDRPHGMAAAYAYHLCQNHPFVDGNKRVAWAAMREFLLREHLSLAVDVETAVNVVLRVAKGEMPKEELAAWIASNARPRPHLELRDFFSSLRAEELIECLTAIANSYHSGGPEELTAIVDEAAAAMPVLTQLAALYQLDRPNNEQAIHYIQLFAALYRLAEDRGYEW